MARTVRAQECGTSARAPSVPGARGAAAGPATGLLGLPARSVAIDGHGWPPPSFLSFQRGSLYEAIDLASGHGAQHLMNTLDGLHMVVTQGGAETAAWRWFRTDIASRAMLEPAQVNAQVDPPGLGTKHRSETPPGKSSSTVVPRPHGPTAPRSCSSAPA